MQKKNIEKNIPEKPLDNQAVTHEPMFARIVCACGHTKEIRRIEHVGIDIPVCPRCGCACVIKSKFLLWDYERLKK